MSTLNSATSVTTSHLPLVKPSHGWACTSRGWSILIQRGKWRMGSNDPFCQERKWVWAASIMGKCIPVLAGWCLITLLPTSQTALIVKSCTNRVLRNNRHVKLIPLREKQSLKTSLSFPFSSPYTDIHHSPHDFLRFGHHDRLLPKKSVVSVWGRFYPRRESKKNLERNLIK